MEKSTDLNRILEYIKSLESRISRIESQLKIQPEQDQPTLDLSLFSTEKLHESVESLEFRIGQFWFAKAGIVILALGIVFLLTFPYKHLPPVFPSFLGYLLVLGILFLSRYLRKTYDFIARYLLGGALVLLYFSTLRLHFFGAHPALENKPILIILLYMVVAGNLFISIRRNSPYLTGISLFMGYLTTLLSGSSYVIFIVLALFSGLAVYFKLKYEWSGVYILGIFLTYFSHFIWFLNNPFLGNKIVLVSSPHLNLFFILVYAAILSMGNLLRDPRIPENNVVITSTFLNSVGVYALLLLISLTRFRIHFTGDHFITSAFFIILAIVFWIREKSKYSTFFYAIIGYTALSAAIISQFKIPDSFIWLSWQSLLVIITAIWFRSKIIVLANFIIFLIIYIAHLILTEKVGFISLSFGVVALLSARIMNWKKHRLELKTEFMRNAYLTTAFIIIPYALYHSVPGAYVSLSWIGVALFYYILSMALNNKKYRWMALLTLLLTVIYVLVIGIARLEPVFRIVSFIALGVVLIVISILYTRSRLKEGTAERPKEE
ncbi:MAG: hypothetical protein Kow0042_05650 [Calditrichia bacterium]